MVGGERLWAMLCCGVDKLTFVQLSILPFAAEGLGDHVRASPKWRSGRQLLQQHFGVLAALGSISMQLTLDLLGWA